MNLNKLGEFAFIILSLLLSPLSFANEGHHHDKELEAATPATDSLFNLDSEWTDQNGKTISLNALKGKPSVIAMIYTSCESACPLIVEDMKKIERQIPENDRAKIQFVLFSFDTERDTSAKLTKYAKARRLEAGWILTKGTPKSVRELAAALGVQFKRSSTGGFQHSNLITLLDQDGVIKKQQSGLANKDDEMSSAAMKLIKN